MGKASRFLAREGIHCALCGNLAPCFSGRRVWPGLWRFWSSIFLKIFQWCLRCWSPLQPAHPCHTYLKSTCYRLQDLVRTQWPIWEQIWFSSTLMFPFLLRWARKDVKVGNLVNNLSNDSGCVFYFLFRPNPQRRCLLRSFRSLFPRSHVCQIAFARYPRARRAQLQLSVS